MTSAVSPPDHSSGAFRRGRHACQHKPSESCTVSSSPRTAIPPSTAREAILGWADAFEILDSTWSAFQSSFDLVADHQLQIWDALILAVSAEHHCRLLLSEDLQHGFTWRGVTIVNPFSHPQYPTLQTILGKV